jgi:hypothetical protein
LFFSCQFLNKQNNKTPIARVNAEYLYKEDIKELIPENATKKDSILIVNNIITNWATQQLLMSGAIQNIHEEKQAEFNALIDQYKLDLYTKAYQEALVANRINTTVNLQDALKVYEANKEAFKLNEELIKFRYILVNENNDNIKELKERIKRFDSLDKIVLDSISIQFKSYSLNDSIWIKLSQAVNKIPAINLQNRKELLKKSNFIQLKDSLGVYLIQIKDVLQRNDLAPLEFVKPTINQIVINKRKLEIIKKIEKDITKDAIKNNDFEIYTPQ